MLGLEAMGEHLIVEPALPTPIGLLKRSLANLATGTVTNLAYLAKPGPDCSPPTASSKQVAHRLHDHLDPQSSVSTSSSRSS